MLYKTKYLSLHHLQTGNRHFAYVGHDTLSYIFVYLQQQKYKTAANFRRRAEPDWPH
jgi:hypothetical protein